MFLSEHFPNQAYVISAHVPYDLRIRQSAEDVFIMKNYKDKFAKFGLEFKIEDIDEGDEDTKNSVVVSTVPTCFMLREENDLRNFRPSPLIRLTRSLIDDIIAGIRATRGGGLAVLPKTINYALNSRACRGE